MTWTLTPAGNYASHIPRWNELNAASVASPLLDAAFVAPLLDHFGTGRELLAICERGGRTVAMALLAPRGKGVWASFQPAQQPLCMWLSVPDEPLAPLLDGLLRALPGLPLLLGLTQCDPQLAPRPSAGARQRTLDYIDTARITLGGGYDAYWEARGKNLRANLKKQRNRLEREGVATRLQLSGAPEEMAAAVADYGRLESAGWKGGEGTAVHADNAQGRFYRAMLEAFCRRGAGCVARYWFGDRLVAMDLCVEGPDSVVVLKTAYDESVDKHFSPALLMREESFRLLFERGLQSLEFYGKVMPWHLQWTDEVRTMYHINYYRWPLLRQLHAKRSSTE
ncbi:GNAT family N-acetyltransferase [Pseudoduganella namucuonensis]|uniref:Acetyltransferase involved in cellulose biosynthesis, CelD/BcsL family n=1 Tax=Pseudoduganella namucuonensis TaxID=1035707 RepID=A0A1I7GGJ6_9BURK|nr:GNAT family N-acetyltransferase [Pseudoduganella namucuonensis]SFU47612.1 Acetyltransferase involved in cellulose biosynthesis, CelD/BcsL family [Pseudoduganella namucuonensis]